MWDVVLDALLDTLKLMPLLLAVHIVIEVFEHKAASGIQMHKALKSRLAPLVGTGLGIIPQCGFSVVATNLYARRAIHLGTLLAVYIATSDEAVPILLSNPSAAVKLLPLLGIKIVLALLVGYAVNLVCMRRTLVDAPDLPTEYGCHHHIVTEHDDHDETAACDDAEEHGHSHPHRNFFGKYLLHPILHTLTIAGFILLVNFCFGTAIYYIGEQRMTAFMTGIRYLQPVLAALIGLIPNCASSVAITQLYALGGLGLGGAVAGLSVNAGLGYAVLFKENRNWKENLLIVVGLFVLTVAVGEAVTLIWN